MARLTVEDCLRHIGNRYDLVLLASKRARQIALGMPTKLEEEEDDKPTVLALREIAQGLINEENVEVAEEPKVSDEEMGAMLLFDDDAQGEKASKAEEPEDAAPADAAAGEAAEAAEETASSDG